MLNVEVEGQPSLEPQAVLWTDRSEVSSKAAGLLRKAGIRFHRITFDPLTVEKFRSEGIKLPIIIAREGDFQGFEPANEGKSSIPTFIDIVQNQPQP